MSYNDKTKEELITELLKMEKSYNALREQYDKELSHLKQVEEKVNKSEEKFRKAFMTSSDSVNINRLSDGMYMSINEGFKKILGYTEEDVIGKTSLELNIWADPGNRTNLVNQLKQNGRVENFEAHFRKKDGCIVTGLMTASIFDLNGVPHILNITKDITVIKRIEEAFTQEQFFMDSLMNNLTDYIYIKDLESRFIRINKSHALELGLDDPDLVIGKTDNDFYSKEHVQQALEDEQTIIKTGQPISKEEKLTHLSGPDTWVSTVKMPFLDNEGNIIGTFGISRDITESKRAEEALAQEQYLMRTLMDNLPDHIYFKDCESRFIRINISHAKSLGLTDADQAIGKTDFDFHSPEHAHLAYNNEQTIIQTGQPLTMEERLIHTNSPDSWVYSTKLPIRNKEGEIIGTFGISRDITKRKLVEEEIKLKNEQLQMLNAEKDKFFSIISHDLRSPFNHFLGFTQIMTEELNSLSYAEIQKMAECMRKSATNLYALLGNLLEWSTMQRNLTDFKPERFRLLPKLKKCVEYIIEPARKKEIVIQFVIPENLEITADNRMFDTVIRNLVSNAIKFTHHGGRIVISAAVDKNSVEMRISDTGIGMNADMVNKLFKLNEKTCRSGTDGEPSTGLGLLLCNDFIKKHGGKIWVESEVGKGSTFIFSIPLPGELAPTIVSEGRDGLK